MCILCAQGIYIAKLWYMELTDSASCLLHCLEPSYEVCIPQYWETCLVESTDLCPHEESGGSILYEPIAIHHACMYMYTHVYTCLLCVYNSMYIVCVGVKYCQHVNCMCKATCTTNSFLYLLFPCIVSV